MKRSDRRKRLDDIALVASSLHAAPIDAPDLTSSILDRVDAERAFLAPSVRRRIHVGRWALGASVALVALSIALTVRWSPQVTQIAGGPAPISTVIRTVETKTDASLDSLRQTVRTVVRTEPERLFTAVAAATKAVEFESPELTPLPTARASSATVFTGPVLPLSAALSMEPSGFEHARGVILASPRLPLKPETSNLSAMAARERHNARAIIDAVSSGATSTILEFDGDGLPAIR